ncbi:hypothetical protein PIIN_10682 [Serendipita indica DSM 11827]|uniref:Uncharacterized protein n=1 Tax=Serendipita indica (strain DSM 11827) TaxID=1109443 RepID=G4TZF1_SERID|nr:hypothetical protein PIIN_10682 [Serendipita indica DSM 11827]
MSLVNSFIRRITFNAKHRSVVVSNSETTHDQISATRTLPPLPVEIWLKIFRLCLGPSLSNPRQTSLHAYSKFVFLSDGETARAYLKKEQTRTVLSLVCRAWHTISKDLDDALQISLLDEFDWPPHRSRGQAKVIHYLQKEPLSYLFDNPVEEYRQSHIPHQQGPRLQDETIQLGNEHPLAPITAVVDYDIWIPPNYTPAQPIQAFRWSPCQIPFVDSPNQLCHPVFSSLVALSLVLFYPPSHPDTYKGIALPELRFLEVVLLESRLLVSSITEGTVSTWQFPRLSIVRVHARENADAKTELRTLVRTHAHQIEELQISDLGDAFPTQYDWHTLCVLRLIVFHSLDQMGDALSSMDTRQLSVATGLSRPHGQVETTRKRLTMSLQYPREDIQSRSAALQKFDACREILHNFNFAVARTWQDLRESFQAVKLYHNESTLEDLRETLALMERLKLDFVDPDGYSFHSEARYFKNEIEDYIRRIGSASA